MRKSGRLSGIYGLWRAGKGIRTAFGVCAAMTLLLFILLGCLGIWLAQEGGNRKSPSMQKLASSVIQPFFIDLVSLEVPHFRQELKGSSTFAGKRVIGHLSGLLLQVNPIHPQSLLAGELRWLGLDSSPPAAKIPDNSLTGAHTNAPSPSPSPSPAQDPIQPTETGKNSSSPVPAPTATPVPQGGNLPVTGSISQLSTREKAVLIYHSHPRESWVPELQAKSLSEAESADKNITLVGKRLAEQLERAGIGTVHSDKDYKKEVPGYNWNFSYKYSLQTVQEAFAVHENLKFVFDLHRDAPPGLPADAREITTAAINGQDYAKIYFIVGKKNENWEQNQAFAKQIHERLQAEYPGISRGIMDKGTGGHGEYNQSVSPNSMLIEVGGAYNTLEESYRSADALAKVIAELFWKAEKVNGTVSANAPGTGAGVSG